MRLCPECGVVLPVDVRFCLQCGTPVIQDTTTPLAAPEPIPVEPPTMAAPAAPSLPPRQEEEPAPPVVFTPAAPPIAAEVAPAETPPARTEVPAEDDTQFDQDFEIRRPVYTPNSTLSLKGSPSPMIAPRDDVPLVRRRSNPGRNMLEIDEEALNLPFSKRQAEEKPLCRFCRGPLDLDGDFCEQCGAPVADALPPGSARNRKPAE